MTLKNQKWVVEGEKAVTHRRSNFFHRKGEGKPFKLCVGGKEVIKTRVANREEGNIEIGTGR